HQRHLRRGAVPAQLSQRQAWPRRRRGRRHEPAPAPAGTLGAAGDRVRHERAARAAAPVGAFLAHALCGRPRHHVPPARRSRPLLDPRGARQPRRAADDDRDDAVSVSYSAAARRAPSGNRSRKCGMTCSAIAVMLARAMSSGMVPNCVLVSDVLKPARSWYSASFSRTVPGLPTITTPVFIRSSMDVTLPVTLAARTRFIDSMLV